MGYVEVDITAFDLRICKVRAEKIFKRVCRGVETSVNALYVAGEYRVRKAGTGLQNIQSTKCSTFTATPAHFRFTFFYFW